MQIKFLRTCAPSPRVFAYNGETETEKGDFRGKMVKLDKMRYEWVT